MIELYRKAAVEAALSTGSARKSFQFWQREIDHIIKSSFRGEDIFNLGDHLRQIFRASSQGRTRESMESNANVSSGGSAWESLVCWYLNLCLVGTSVVVVKSKKDLVPKFLSDAISVKYNSFKSNTEADLIYIAFPAGGHLPVKRAKETFATYLDRIIPSSMSLKELSVGIVQTKTNWNDNAQIPMLWDMVYSGKEFGRNVSVGSNGKSITSFNSFSYSFVTVPTQKDAKKFKVTSVAVNRVRNISGGNFWGLPTEDGVADSLKEFFNKNLKDYIPNSNLISHLDDHFGRFMDEYGYFGLNQFRPLYRLI